jgi:hypothetical protein
MKGKAELDPLASEAGKQEGMENVERGAPPGWMSQATAIIRWLALRFEYVTADDMWAKGLEHPGEGRAIGPAMKRGEKLGLIEPTREFVLTVQSRSHRAPMRVWRSRLYGGPPSIFSEETLYSRLSPRPDDDYDPRLS